MDAATKPTTRTVTNAQLAAFGFPVETFETVCAMKIRVTEGVSRSAAVHSAWAAGFITLDFTPWVRPAPVNVTIDAETQAWIAEQKALAAA